MRPTILYTILANNIDSALFTLDPTLALYWMMMVCIWTVFMAVAGMAVAGWRRYKMMQVLLNELWWEDQRCMEWTVINLLGWLSQYLNQLKIVTGIGKWVDLGQPIIGLLIAFCLIGQIFIFFGRGTLGGNFNLVMSNWVDLWLYWFSLDGKFNFEVRWKHSLSWLEKRA